MDGTIAGILEVELIEDKLPAVSDMGDQYANSGDDDTEGTDNAGGTKAYCAGEVRATGVVRPDGGELKLRGVPPGRSS